MPTSRSSLRRQIVGPVIAITAVAFAVMAAVCSFLWVRQVDRNLTERVERVAAVMRHTGFPLSTNVLFQMREISGAHFVVWGAAGEVRAATFEDRQFVEQLRPHLHTRAGRHGIGNTPPVSLNSQRYLLDLVKRDPPSQDVVMILYPGNELASAGWYAALAPCLIGTATLLAVWFALRKITSRLARRLDAVRRGIAEISDGDYRTIPDPRNGSTGAGDEIAELIDEINRMSLRIRSMRELIGRTERARVLGQLAGGLAHQMRNALTGTRLAVQIHERRCLTSREEESLTVALQQLNVMEEHMKRLLSVGKQEKRSIRWFHVRVLLAEVETLVEPFCKHSRVEIDHSLPTLKVLQIHGDSEALRNALLNLVMNGIEAAGPGGHVEVRAFPDREDVVFEVLDNGPGPPPEIAPQLFEPFVSGKSEGVGLGLSVVRQAVVQHQGSVMWERLDEKTCFRIRLPKIPSRTLQSEPRPTPDPAPLGNGL